MRSKQKRAGSRRPAMTAGGKNGSRPPAPAPQEAEALYRGLFNRMADAVFVIDAETLRFLDCNQAACEAYGYSREELLSMTPLPLHPPEERDLAQRRLMEKKWAPREYRHVARDGRRLTVEIRTTDVHYQGRPAHLSIVHDVTERQQAEHTLQLQKAYLEQLIESAPEAVAILDNRNTVLRVNREFTQVFGYLPEEIVGRSLEVLVPIERMNESSFIWHELACGKTISVETIRRRKNGSPVEVSILGTPISVAGSPVAVYLIYRDITQSKHAERALIESESKFRAVAETAASAIYIHEDDRFLYVNRACELISGYTRQEFMQMEPWAIVHPEFRNLLRQRNQARQRGEPVPSRYEFKIVTKNGETRWLDLSANSIRFEGRSATLATAVDISERKRAEELQRALYRIADQTSAAGDLPAFYAAIHSIVSELMNARNFYVALYDEGTGLLSFPYFVDEEDPAPAPKTLGKGLTEYVLRTGEPLLASPQRFQELVRSGDVQMIGAPSIDWLGVPMKQGDEVFGVLVVQTYTENIRYGARDEEILNFVGQHVAAAIQYKRAENALRESEARYRSLVHSAVYGIYRSGLDDRFDAVNPAMVAMLGYESEQEVKALRISRDVFVDPQERARLIELYCGSERVDGVEVRWKRKDGEAFTVRLSGKPLYDAGKLVGFEMIAEDVSERRILEEQLRLAQKMEAIGRLAGGVAHDFNNLLTVVKGYTELLLADLKPSDPMRPEMEEVQKAADRAAALTRQLLAFSRRQVLAPKVLNLNYLVEDMNKLLLRLLGEDIQLSVALDPALGSAKADPSQIEQVIMNLAVNARDAMPKGGKLTLETANVDLDKGYTREHVTVRPGPYVMLAVSDTGMGMDEETCSHIFEPFFTTKQGKGTGLGLSTVYGIVKQSGGYIWVYSEPGMGTTFKMYLPRVEQPAERMPARPQAEPGLGGTETVLLVEDEEGVRTLIRQVLERNGYTVLQAAKPNDALELCRQHAGKINLLLTDVVLSEMSGSELGQRLTSMRQDMKVLYMSGYTDEAIVQHGVLQPGTWFLQKPFATQLLLRKIREVLEG